MPEDIEDELLEELEEEELEEEIEEEPILEELEVADEEEKKEPEVPLNTIYTTSPLISYAAADVIKPESTIMFVQGSGGPVTLTSNPSIVDGINGQLILLIGRSDTNTLTITDGNGVQFGAASRVLGLNDILMLIYEGTYANDWLEISFSQL